MTDVSETGCDAVVEINLKATLLVTQACVTRMTAEGVAGSMIHIGSQMGHCASKWGLEGMRKAFALDLAPRRIRSNTVAPTFIDMPLTRPFFEDERFKASVLAKIKLSRIGTVEDLMGAVMFLAGDASSMVTGTSLIVEGGWTAD